MSTLASDLSVFVGSMDFDRFAADLSDRTSVSRRRFKQLFSIFSNEATAALNVLEPHLQCDYRVLEVGAGLCIMSLFLRERGWDIVALEPAQGGYDFMGEMLEAVLAECSGIGLPVLRVSANELDEREHGSYDLVFSHNVLEHVADIEPALVGMTGVLRPAGKMVHVCPNFVVPFDPHFNVPVIARWPGLTRWLFRKRIQPMAAIWDSLNFITAWDVQRMARRLDLEIVFERHVMHGLLRRLTTDELLRERHNSPVMRFLMACLESTRGISLIRHLPPTMATPMIFSLSHRRRTS